MSFKVIDENENVLLDLPLETGRVDITASREGGYIQANAYQFGHEDAQFNHLQIVVTLGEVAADRTATVPASVLDETPHPQDDLAAAAAQEEPEE